jgi:hypothetical protein
VVKHAVIQLLALDTPEGERPRIAVGPDEHFDTSPEERNRIAHEAGRAALLVTEAPDNQAYMLERLAGIAPEGELRFSFVATLERFLDETAKLDDASAAALSDDQLLGLWRDAERKAGETHRRSDEPCNGY